MRIGEAENAREDMDDDKDFSFVVFVLGRKTCVRDGEKVSDEELAGRNETRFNSL